MAVYDSTNMVDPRVLLSQTPVNATPQNYYLKELQEKVNADWKYRPNHFVIEREDGFGSNNFEQLEVVLQTVRTDKGEKISDVTLIPSAQRLVWAAKQALGCALCLKTSLHKR